MISPAEALASSLDRLARVARLDRCASLQRVQNSRFGPHNGLAKGTAHIPLSRFCRSAAGALPEVFPNPLPTVDGLGIERLALERLALASCQSADRPDGLPGRYWTNAPALEPF